ncbi:MAG: hypothetical protein U0136_10355 [Bdellovibrionota bacterium]
MALFPCESDGHDHDDEHDGEPVDYLAIALDDGKGERCSHGILIDPSQPIPDCDSCLLGQVARLLASGEH